MPGTFSFDRRYLCESGLFTHKHPGVAGEGAEGIHEYTANLHQLLQLAANLTEPVTTNRPFAQLAANTFDRLPLVFRPQFG